MTRNLLTRTALLLAAMAATPMAACSIDSPDNCVAAARVGKQPEPVALLLADGRSAALDAAVRSVSEDPAGAFSAPQLGFSPAVVGEEATPGVVLLATYDLRGDVTLRGSFNLAGHGEDPKVRALSRRGQARCLARAVQALPEPAAQPNDLLRALHRAAATAVAESGGGPAVVIATGLGRSAIDGTPVNGIDLSHSGQEEVFKKLDAVGLIPDLSASNVAVRFLDPSEGIDSSITEASVEAFAESLCKHIKADPCNEGPTIR